MDEIPEALPGSVNVIVACDENDVIGKGGRLPWRIREDWMWFLARTKGGACVIGRKSYESMLRGGSVNDKRRFCVVSSNPSLAGEFAQVFPSCAAAVAAAKASGLAVWICGGPRLYEEALPLADRFYLTRVHAEVEGGDAWMPDWSGYFGGEPIYEKTGRDAAYSYTFQVFARI